MRGVVWVELRPGGDCRPPGGLEAALLREGGAAAETSFSTSFSTSSSAWGGRSREAWVGLSSSVFPYPPLPHRLLLALRRLRDTKRKVKEGAGNEEHGQADGQPHRQDVDHPEPRALLGRDGQLSEDPRLEEHKDER
ncbi:hypothetical protein EYF80_066001 [Liparis tanakae]|uniref:Uncharacterized protein n=1 Tax=Liparis tanakae TaxID=230148 RepID=A0A4Z2E4N7_9TELE|nr:hypothetical protein EYF80_066001 [Liparis tanakae]